jgi:hypothetical protein
MFLAKNEHKKQVFFLKKRKVQQCFESKIPKLGLTLGFGGDQA